MMAAASGSPTPSWSRLATWPRTSVIAPRSRGSASAADGPDRGTGAPPGPRDRGGGRDAAADGGRRPDQRALVQPAPAAEPVGQDAGSLRVGGQVPGDRDA